MIFKKKKHNEQTELINPDINLPDEESTDDADNVFSDTDDMDSAMAVKKKKLPAWVIFPIIAVIALAVFGLSKLGGTGTSTGSTSLAVTEVTRGTVKEVYNASGTIESENTKTYYSPVTAPISNLNAVVGQAVKSGDLLVTFDTTNLERDNQQAQLTLQSTLNTSQSTREQNAKTISEANAANAELAAQANTLAQQVNELGARLAAAQTQYQANQDSYNSAATQAQITELQNQITTLNAQIQEYQNTIQTLATVYEGSGSSYAEAVATPESSRTDAQKKLIEDIDNYNNTIVNLAEAQSALNTATASLTTLTTVDDAGYTELAAEYDTLYAQWETAYAAAQNQTTTAGMTSSELSNLDISDNLAELTALTSEELLEKGREGMKADMDGVIASVSSTTESSSATQGMAVFSIASADDVRVTIEVSPDDYDKMTVGNTASITVGNSSYEGTLSNVNKIATTNEKGNPVIKAQIHISNPDENICIGATAKISMTVAESDNVLVVPTEAINASTEGDFVFVIENGVVKKKYVELGNSSTTQVEIISGLEEGDQVVNDLSVDITEGMAATGVVSEE